MRDQDIEQALNAIGRRPVPPSTVRARRDDVLDAMVDAADGVSAHRTGKRPIAMIAVAVALATAAASSALMWRASVPTAGVAAPTAPVGYAHRLSGEVMVVGSAGVAAAPAPSGAQGVPLRDGYRVATLEGGQATVHLGVVAAATLAPSSELAISAVPTDCAVRVGSVAFEVAPLGAAGQFVVHTPDVDVVVHGTSFRVTVDRKDGEDAPRSEVAVTSGVVVVRPHTGEEVRLVAGGRWSAKAAPTAPVAADARATAEARQRDTPPPAASTKKSDLAEQNRLLGEAAAASQRGDAAAESSALDSFVRRFPRSPGAHEALASRMRLAVRAGDADAAAGAARRYLALFPDGPLRDQAISLSTRKAP